MSKRKVELYLVNDCGGEWEEAWNEPVIASRTRKMPRDARSLANHVKAF